MTQVSRRAAAEGQASAESPSRHPGRRPAPHVPEGNTTTTWGVVLALAFVGATLALNAPGGSTSIAGRALTATMVTLFPSRPDAPAARPVTAPPKPQLGGTRAPGAAPPADAPADGVLTEEVIARSAIRARGHLSHAPTGVRFRNVYAVNVLGVFNAVEPGKAFLGFCGEISIPEGRTGWGRYGWKPFFVSETVSNPRGQTPYLDQANPGTDAKCANAKPGHDYSAVFNAGPTDTPSSRLGMPPA
jgi:hypothetical protein